MDAVLGSIRDRIRYNCVRIRDSLGHPAREDSYSMRRVIPIASTKNFNMVTVIQPQILVGVEAGWKAASRWRFIIHLGPASIRISYLDTDKHWYSICVEEE